MNEDWQCLEMTNAEGIAEDYAENVYYRVVDASEMGKPLYVLAANGCEDTTHASGCVTVNADVTDEVTDAPSLTFTAAAIQYDGLAPQGTETELDAAIEAFKKLPDDFTSGIIATTSEAGE